MSNYKVFLFLKKLKHNFAKSEMLLKSYKIMKKINKTAKNNLIIF